MKNSNPQDNVYKNNRININSKKYENSYNDKKNGENINDNVSKRLCGNVKIISNNNDIPLKKS